MVEKYYTPDITEFHVGFECELRNSSSELYEWEPFKIVGVDDGEISGSKMDWSFYDSANAIKDEMIRVKYLDKQDIEECGFKYAGNDMYDILEYNDIRGYFDAVHLIIRGTWVLISIGKKNSDINNFATIFAGAIKNKSELKKILKMINIF